MPGFEALPSVSSDRSVARANGGKFTASVFRPGAAPRRSARSGVVSRATFSSSAIVGPSSRRASSSRSKSVERSSRRCADATAVSPASSTKRTTSAERASSLPTI